MSVVAQFFLIFLAFMIEGNTYENVYGPLYSEEWLLMADDDDIPRYMNFSYIPNDNTSRTYASGDTYFYLYTRANQFKEEELKVTGSNFNSSYFNVSNDLKIMTHGWLSHGKTSWLLQIKDAYLQSKDFNVVTVDWSESSQTPVYPWSAIVTKTVGQRVAGLIDAMAGRGVGGDRVHLIGHSLGAQVMGYAGAYSKGNLSRITGLDPARPLFEIPNRGNENILDKSDADYVDIIHSCGKVFGYGYSHGHADFYPNSGLPAQPGCQGIQYMLESCSHGRSHEYYLESIEYQDNSKKGFVSYNCENWDQFNSGNCTTNNINYMGAYVDTGRQGNYYLHTNAASKYAKGEE